MQSALANVLSKYQPGFHPVIPFDPQVQHLAAVDLREDSKEVPAGISSNPAAFREHMVELRRKMGADFLVGGYGELRGIYDSSAHFATTGEPRRLHLGVDIWGPAGTPVFAFAGGMVHSTAFNSAAGDYGATLILLHQLEGIPFYTLYGHISLADIRQISAGQYVSHGQEIAHFGEPEENGHWPPHLHFQVIADLGGREGDFPGVCRFSEKAGWLANCPDPELILQWSGYLP